MEPTELLALPAAVCCMEMQRGVVGDLSTVPGTTAAVRSSGIVDAIAGVLAAARSRGLPVVHCTASFRPDGTGSFGNMPMIERLRSTGRPHLLTGTPSVEVIPELWDADHDVTSERHHGIAPFTGTSLATLLRSRRVETVVAVGVSLNRGILGTAIEAVGNGFHVVVPRDCVVGYPDDYGEAVLRHSLDGLVTLTTAAAVTAAWSRPSGSSDDHQALE